MEDDYGVCIFNKEEEYIIKPFFSNIPKIKKLYIITDKKSDLEIPRRKIVDFLEEINIVPVFIYVNDITNFFQIFSTIKILCKKEGPPTWVNISCGSGIGMAALTIHAIEHKVKMLLFEKENDKTITFDINQIQKLDLFDNRYLNIVNDIKKGKNTIDKIACEEKIDRTTAYRRIRKLLFFEIVKTENNNKPLIFSLTDFGEILFNLLLI